MLEFLVAMTYVFFHNSDTVTRTFLGVLLGFLVLVVMWVIILESSATSEEGTARERICKIGRAHV